MTTRTTLEIQGDYNAGGAFAKAGQGLNNLTKNASITNKSLGGLGKALGGAAKFLTGPLGLSLSAGAAAGTITTLGVNALRTAGRMSIFGQRVGLSATAMRTFTRAARRVGEDITTVEGFFESFQDRIGEVLEGTGEGADVFNKMGLSVRDAGGEVKSTETLLREFTGRLNTLGSEQERVTVLTRLFGTDGIRLGNILGDVSDEAFDVNEAFEENARQSRAVLTNWGRLTDAIGGFVGDIFVSFSPALNLISDWLADNAETIRSELLPIWQEWASELTKNLPTVLDDLQRILREDVGPALLSVRDLVTQASKVFGDFFNLYKAFTRQDYEAGGFAHLVRGLGELNNLLGFGTLQRFLNFVGGEGRAERAQAIADLDQLGRFRSGNLLPSDTETFRNIVEEAVGKAVTGGSGGSGGSGRRNILSTGGSGGAGLGYDIQELTEQLRKNTEALKNDRTRRLIEGSSAQRPGESLAEYARRLERLAAAYEQEVRNKAITGVLPPRELFRFFSGQSQYGITKNRLVGPYEKYFDELKLRTYSFLPEDYAGTPFDRPFTNDLGFTFYRSSLQEQDAFDRAVLAQNAVVERIRRQLEELYPGVNRLEGGNEALLEAAWGDFLERYQDIFERFDVETSAGANKQAEFFNTLTGQLDAYALRQIEYETKRFELRTTLEARHQEIVDRNQAARGAAAREENRIREQGIASFKRDTSEAIQGLIQGTRSWGDAFQSILNGVVNRFVQRISDDVADSLIDSVLRGTKGARGLFEGLANGLPGLFTGFFAFLTQGFRAVIQAAANDFSLLGQGIQGVFAGLFGGGRRGGIGGFLANAAGGLFGNFVGGQIGGKLGSFIGHAAGGTLSGLLGGSGGGLGGLAGNALGKYLFGSGAGAIVNPAGGISALGGTGAGGTGLGSIFSKAGEGLSSLGKVFGGAGAAVAGAGILFGLHQLFGAENRIAPEVQRRNELLSDLPNRGHRTIYDITGEERRAVLDIGRIANLPDHIGTAFKDIRQSTNDIRDIADRIAEAYGIHGHQLGLVQEILRRQGLYGEGPEGQPTGYGTGIPGSPGYGQFIREERDYTRYLIGLRDEIKANRLAQDPSLQQQKRFYQENFPKQTGIIEEINKRIEEEAGAIEAQNELLASIQQVLKEQREELGISKDQQNYESYLSNKRNQILEELIAPNRDLLHEQRFLSEHFPEQTKAIQDLQIEYNKQEDLLKQQNEILDAIRRELKEREERKGTVNINVATTGDPQAVVGGVQEALYQNQLAGGSLARR